MADISKIIASDGITYDLKDSIARSVLNVITDTFVDALDNHTVSFEGLDFRTVSGNIVTFDTRVFDLN